MNYDRPKGLAEAVRVALREDIGREDITARLIIPENKKVNAVIIALESGILCGIAAAQEVFRQLDKNIRFTPVARDGNKVKKGQVLARLSGNAGKILSGERTALNFLGLLSGIAGKTRRFVERVGLSRVKILDTRKTLPLLRGLQKYAVCIGNGYNHRLRLDEMVLIKDNHIRALRAKQPGLSIGRIIEKANRNKPAGIKVEIEVNNLKQFRQALQAKPDIIMLDNMKVEQVKKAVILRNRYSPAGRRLPKIEVSGNIDLDNVKKYAACRVDFISVGGLTKDAESLDVTLDIVE